MTCGKSIEARGSNGCEKRRVLSPRVIGRLLCMTVLIVVAGCKDHEKRVKALGGVYEAESGALGLEGKAGNDTTIAVVHELPVVTILTLEGSSVTDAGLKHLAELKELWLLNLKGTTITDNGLKELAGLTNLRTLNLQGTKITDAGLVHLKGLKNLAYLSLYKTSISAEAANGLPPIKTIVLPDGTEIEN